MKFLNERYKETVIFLYHPPSSPFTPATSYKPRLSYHPIISPLSRSGEAKSQSLKVWAEEE